MADVKWIKIVTDIFNNKKIKQIDAMPDADSILVIWFKLICLAGNINESGLIVLTKDLAYTDEMLATEFRKPLNTIRLALKIFENFGMIEIVDNIYRISNWEKYQNIEGLEKIREQTRHRVAKHRENQRLLTSNVTVTHGNATDIDKNKNKKEKKKEKKDIYSDSVYLSDTEYQKLIEQYGLSATKEMITILDNYKGSSGKKYKSDYKAILSWVVDSYKNKKPKTQETIDNLKRWAEDE